MMPAANAAGTDWKISDVMATTTVTNNNALYNIFFPFKDYRQDGEKQSNYQ
jgi:hypothetical protein